MDQRPASEPRLDYEQRASFVSQKQYRRLMALTLLNTILLAGFVIGPTVGPMVKSQWQQLQDRREAKRQEQQRRSMIAQAKAYRAPVDQVVYEENPVEAAKLLAEGPSLYQAVRTEKMTYLPPRPWQPPVFRKDAAPLTGYPIVFLHARKTPAGQERLVRVEVIGEQKMRETAATPQRNFTILTERALAVSLYPSDTSLERARVLLLNLHPAAHPSSAAWFPADSGANEKDRWQHGRVEFDPRDLIRLYAGQPDPADESHFTIAYERDGRPGIIDGWLRDNGPPELLPREGGIVDRSENGREVVWDPTVRRSPSTTTLP